MTVCLQPRQCRRAGSDVATTCSYQASFAGFERAGVGRGDAEALLRRSVRLADSARQRFWAEHSEALADVDDARADAHADAAGAGGALANGGAAGEAQCNGEPGGGAGREGGGARSGSEAGSAQGLAGWQWARGRPLVAFSLGSYGAALADGSEFTGAYGARVTEAQLMAFHRERIQARAASGRVRTQACGAARARARGGSPASPAACVRSMHSAPWLLAPPRAVRRARTPTCRHGLRRAREPVPRRARAGWRGRARRAAGRAQAVAHEPSVDVLAFETVPCEAEVRAIGRLLRTEGDAGHLPAWVSCACRDEVATGAGDSLAGECLPAALGAPAVAAFGINCTVPRLVAPLLRVRALVLACTSPAWCAAASLDLA